MKEVFTILLLVFSLQFVWAQTETSESTEAPEFPNPKLFPMPRGYEPNVRFWMRVYSEWGEDQVVIHDSRYMDIIFDVISIPEENDMLRAASNSEVRASLEKYKNILMDLHNDPNSRTISKKHQEVYDLYKNISE